MMCGLRQKGQSHLYFKYRLLNQRRAIQRNAGHVGVVGKEEHEGAFRQC